MRVTVFEPAIPFSSLDCLEIPIDPSVSSHATANRVTLQARTLWKSKRVVVIGPKSTKTQGSYPIAPLL